MRSRRNLASSWLMRVKTVNAESTRDRYEICKITRDKRWHRDLYEASQTQKYALLRFRRAIKRRKPPRWSPGAIGHVRPFHGHLHPLASRALRKVCDQLRPDSLETPGYGKRCSIGYLSACSTLIPALSSLKPSTFTHRLRVGDRLRAEPRPS